LKLKNLQKVVKANFWQMISVYNSKRIIKIGQYLQKLCSNEKGSIFSDSQCSYSLLM